MTNFVMSPLFHRWPELAGYKENAFKWLPVKATDLMNITEVRGTLSPPTFLYPFQYSLTVPFVDISFYSSFEDRLSLHSEIPKRVILSFIQTYPLTAYSVSGIFWVLRIQYDTKSLGHGLHGAYSLVRKHPLKKYNFLNIN